MRQEAGQAEVIARRVTRRFPALPAIARRSLIVACLAVMAGCASAPPEPVETPEAELPTPEVDPLPPEEPAPEPAPAPAPPPPEPPEEPAPMTVAIVLSDRSAAFENVAAELASRLEEPLLYNLADRSLPPEDAFSGISEAGADVVIAIGFRAAEAAQLFSKVPVVYCQVFNFPSAESGTVPIKGVSSIPPLDLQVQAWKKLDPELRSIGAILGAGHDQLVAEAERATSGHEISFHHRIAASDRETLYIFRRLAPGIDGYWLFPDNRVLSVPVLREILEVARRHNVRVAVFNDALLELGAALSSASTDADIATKVLSVAESLVKGDADQIPDLTPLGEVGIRTGDANRNPPDALARGQEDVADAAGSRL